MRRRTLFCSNHFSSLIDSPFFFLLLFDPLIVACNCGSGSTNSSCSLSGQCNCVNGFTGLQCASCLPNYFGQSCQGFETSFILFSSFGHSLTHTTLELWLVLSVPKLFEWNMQWRVLWQWDMFLPIRMDYQFFSWMWFVHYWELWHQLFWYVQYFISSFGSLIIFCVFSELLRSFFFYFNFIFQVCVQTAITVCATAVWVEMEHAVVKLGGATMELAIIV